MKKILASVLALAMILGVCLMAGCNDVTETTTGTNKPTESSSTKPQGGAEETTTANQGGAEETTTANQGGAEETTTASQGGEEQPSTWDGYTKLPGYEDVTFRGAVFNIAVYEGFNDPDYDNGREVYSDKTDQISVAANERTRLVEQLYDCEIEVIGAPNPNTLVSAAATGGTVLHLSSWMGDFKNTYGNRYNLYSLDMDLTQEWWNQTFVNSMTLKKTNGTNSLYSITGDFAVGSNAYTHALMFNTTLYDNMVKDTYGSIYDYVRNGTWTMDVFLEMMKLGTYDSDGNSNFSTDECDTVGWVSTNLAAQGLHAASGLTMFTNTDGKLSFSMYDNAAQWDTIISKSIEVYDSPYHEVLSYTPALQALVDGKVLFYSELLSKLEKDEARNAENLNVSVVPYPKFSETQENYANFVETHYIHYAIPLSVSNIDEVADFFTVYAAHSSKIVRAAWLDTYAYDYLSGAESREMLELVLNSRTFDPGYIILGFQGEVNGMITSSKNNTTQLVNRRYQTYMGDSGTVAELITKIDTATS